MGIFILQFLCLTFAGRQFFFNTGSFTGQAAQVVQFGATDVTAAFYFDFFYGRGVELESTLNAFTAGNFADDTKELTNACCKAA